MSRTAWVGVVLALAAGATIAATADDWTNISDAFCKQIGAFDGPSFNRRTSGIAVDPTSGRVFMLLCGRGLYASDDHGDTWARFKDNPVTGRCETGFAINMHYPFTGRMLVAVLEGKCAMTVDGGDTWQTLADIGRNFDYIDADWSTPRPQVLFALRHEADWGHYLSTDGGTSWTMVEQGGRTSKLGVISATTLVKADSAAPGVFRSTDLGRTWQKVAEHRVYGCRPVHFGKRLYWAAEEGVIASDDGAEWRLHGSPLAGATWGPYFGRTEKELMVVTAEGFHVSTDGAATWKRVAPYFDMPDSGGGRGFSKDATLRHFSWDAAGGFLYGSRLAASAYRRSVP
jgi:photosystem II stability/assembly factor-like uncharacterized protein